jgi:CMP-N,N'-diacetyllegionaminic acid synthase
MKTSRETLQENIIIIPARKDSKSIKNKNIKLFCGKPLIYWTIKLALESKLGLVCVSTDCKKIRNYSISLGAFSPFLRPKKLSTDKAKTEDVIIHALNYYFNSGKLFKSFFLLQPTSPFRSVKDLINSWKIFKKKKFTSVFSVTESIANHNPYWMIIKDKKNIARGFKVKKLSKFLSRRQDLPKVFFRNDFLYLSKVQNLLNKSPNLYGNKPGLLVINKDRLDYDLNTIKDWAMAETLFRKFGNKIIK